MIIEHIAVWTHDIERLRNFYCSWFEGISNDRYHNTRTDFSSYFITFKSGARLELMQMQGIPRDEQDIDRQRTGLIHIALQVGGEDTVRALAERMRGAGIRVVGEPRHTGDGYFESCVLDPDGNRIELVA